MTSPFQSRNLKEQIARMGKWDARFLDLAEHVAQWSKDPSTKVGAVVVRPDRTVVSIGYNGFPRGVSDHEERYADRETKYQYVVHAEINAILTGRDVDGCTLYVSPLSPCPQCAAAIVQCGISRVVARVDQSRDDWKQRLEVASTILQEADVSVTLLTTVPTISTGLPPPVHVSDRK